MRIVVWLILVTSSSSAVAAKRSCERDLGFTLSRACRSVVATHDRKHKLIRLTSNCALGPRVTETLDALPATGPVVLDDVGASFYNPEETHHLRTVLDAGLADFIDALAPGEVFMLSGLGGEPWMTARLVIGRLMVAEDDRIYRLDLPDAASTWTDLEHQRTCDFEAYAPDGRVIVSTLNLATALSILRRASRRILPRTKAGVGSSPRVRKARRVRALRAGAKTTDA